MYMSTLITWVYVLATVCLAITANSISAIWATQENKLSSPWLFAILIISPLVFITFGLVTSKFGLATASGTADALLTAGTILVGLFIFRELSSVSSYQFLGMALSVVGIILMQLHK